MRTHGIAATYTGGKCRCPACTAAHRLAAEEYSRKCGVRPQMRKPKKPRTARPPRIPLTPEERRLKKNAYYRARYAQHKHGKLVDQLAKKREYRKAYYQKNKEALATARRAWRQAHPEHPQADGLRRRSAKASAPGSGYTTHRHITMRWEMWGGRCWMCGGMAGATDHVIPLSRGGTHWPANLRPSCKTCNSRKGTRVIRTETTWQTPLPLPA